MTKPKTVRRDFFIRDTLKVAYDLLGMVLVIRKKDGRRVERMITEVEAYDGLLDTASHASCGKTARNAPMFSLGGIWYVYLIYGMYDMLNIVTGPKAYPAAVLIRGVEGIDGPGKITRFFGITRAYNNQPANRESGLWIEDWQRVMSAAHITKTPRIGVAYAGSVWARKPYRFLYKK